MKIRPPPAGIASKGTTQQQQDPSLPQRPQHRSTSEAVLEEIQSSLESPLRIIVLILEFRSLNKLLTSFLRPIPKLAREAFVPVEDKKESNAEAIWRIHPVWMQTAVRTGRLSCRQPNMQQIPKEGAFGVTPRDAFCASSAQKCLFACDYSQIEVRIMAHMCGDPSLLAVFGKEQTLDIYKQMSAALTGKPAADVSGQERAVAKQVVLAIMYGMGIPQVAKKLKVNRTRAQRFFDLFYGRFPYVRPWVERTKEAAKRSGFVTTIVGRRRYLDEIHSADSGRRAQAERQAVNTIIQGSAADLMKLAMIKMSARLQDWRKEVANGRGSGVVPTIILQIHDELLFEVMDNHDDISRLKEAVLRCCTTECERDLKLKVPLKLTCSIGKSWGEGMTDLK